MQNIGVAFVKMAQFSDAVTSFEHIMGEKASFQTGMWSRKILSLLSMMVNALCQLFKEIMIGYRCDLFAL